jgi:hypothetical protein
LEGQALKDAIVIVESLFSCDWTLACTNELNVALNARSIPIPATLIVTMRCSSNGEVIATVPIRRVMSTVMTRLRPA